MIAALLLIDWSSKKLDVYIVKSWHFGIMKRIVENIEKGLKRCAVLYFNTYTNRMYIIHLIPYKWTTWSKAQFKYLAVMHRQFEAKVIPMREACCIHKAMKLDPGIRFASCAMSLSSWGIGSSVCRVSGYSAVVVGSRTIQFCDFCTGWDVLKFSSVQVSNSNEIILLNYPCITLSH